MFIFYKYYYNTKYLYSAWGFCAHVEWCNRRSVKYTKDEVSDLMCSYNMGEEL